MRTETTMSERTALAGNAAGPKKKLGEIYYDLLVESDWVHRQVDALRIAEAGQTRRQVSLDLTVPRELPAWQDACLAATSETEAAHPQIAVPLAFLEKRMIQGLDVHLEGKSLPVLTSWQNVEISMEILGYLTDSLESVSEGVRDLLKALAGRSIAESKSAPITGESTVLDLLRETLQTVADKTIMSERETAALLGLNNYAQTFSNHFLLLVLVPAAMKGSRVIIKYSHDQVDERPRTPIGGR